MEKFIVILGCIFLSSCNTKRESTAITDVADTMVVKNTMAESVTDADSTQPNMPDTVAIKDPLQGRHSLTIQWLTFDKGSPGIAFINKTDGEWYSIKGEQQNAEGYLKIDGKIKMIDPKQLSFDGIISYQIRSINDGEICVKEGKQIFLSTLNRKYWRMRDMGNCDGTTTDYIDIFF